MIHVMHTPCNAYNIVSCLYFFLCLKYTCNKVRLFGNVITSLLIRRWICIHWWVERWEISSSNLILDCGDLHGVIMCLCPQIPPPPSSAKINSLDLDSMCVVCEQDTIRLLIGHQNVCKSLFACPVHKSPGRTGYHLHLVNRTETDKSLNKVIFLK